MARTTLTQIAQLAASLAACYLAALIGSVFTRPAIPQWYAGLHKPSFAPPNWVFGPVWTALYLMMAIAAFLVWREGWDNPQVRRALALFGVQLLLNAGWSPVFFGLRWPVGGLAVIGVLWVFIVATILTFFRVSKPAAVLLIPYLLWVSFATVLNSAIVTLNR